MDSKTQDYLSKLAKIDLPSGDWAIFGSAPMMAHGLKDKCHDLDIIARNSAWEKALTLGDVEQADMGDHVVRLFNNTIEIFDGWKPGEWNTSDLIDNAEIIDGFPYVKLVSVLEWKKRMGRTKDIKEIPIIEKYLAKK